MSEPLPPEVEEDYASFWVDIVAANGVRDWNQVKRELYDYHWLMREVTKVYDELTVGRISKPDTEAMHVIQAVRAAQREQMQWLCPICYHDLRGILYEQPWFTVTDSQVGHDGEQPIYAVHGVQTCPECGATWPLSDSN